MHTCGSSHLATATAPAARASREPARGGLSTRSNLRATPTESGLFDGVLRQRQRVFGPPFSGRRPSVTAAVGLTGPLDPEVCVHERVAGLAGRGHAESPARRIAPFPARGGAPPVAAGI